MYEAPVEAQGAVGINMREKYNVYKPCFWCFLVELSKMMGYIICGMLSYDNNLTNTNIQNTFIRRT